MLALESAIMRSEADTSLPVVEVYNMGMCQNSGPKRWVGSVGFPFKPTVTVSTPLNGAWNLYSRLPCAMPETERHCARAA